MSVINYIIFSIVTLLLCLSALAETNKSSSLVFCNRLLGALEASTNDDFALIDEVETALLMFQSDFPNSSRLGSLLPHFNAIVSQVLRENSISPDVNRRLRAILNVVATHYTPDYTSYQGNSAENEAQSISDLILASDHIPKTDFMYLTDTIDQHSSAYARVEASIESVSTPGFKVEFSSVAVEDIKAASSELWLRFLRLLKAGKFMNPQAFSIGVFASIQYHPNFVEVRQSSHVNAHRLIGCYQDGVLTIHHLIPEQHGLHDWDRSLRQFAAICRQRP